MVLNAVRVQHLDSYREILVDSGKISLKLDKEVIMLSVLRLECIDGSEMHGLRLVRKLKLHLKVFYVSLQTVLFIF